MYDCWLGVDEAKNADLSEESYPAMKMTARCKVMTHLLTEYALQGVCEGFAI